jgi:formate/nitrite transporter FocA (FNT family)
MARRDRATLLQVLRLWAVVLASNLGGTFLFAWVLESTGVFEPGVKQVFRQMGEEALRGDFGTTLLRGIFAGWLIALMVWLLPVAETARHWIVILLTYVVGLASLSHIIAGSVEVLYVVNAGAVTWRDYFAGFLLPTFLGNVLGGVTLVAGLNHAQTVAGNGSSAA